MLAAALVDLDHDGAHHPRLSHCHLLLSPWHISIGSGYYMINVSAHSNMLNPTGSLPSCSFLPALLSFSTPTLLVLVAMSIWLTVLAAYWALGNKYHESVR